MNQAMQAETGWRIEQLIRRFAFLNDRHDHDGLADLFVSEGLFARPSAPDSPTVGREAIRAFFRERPKRQTCHVMTNTVVDITSSDRARAHSYVTLHVDGTVTIGEFADQFVQVDGQWLFVERRGRTLP